jgi:hypothetical protein
MANRKQHVQLSFPFAKDLPVTPRWKSLARRLVRLLWEYEQEDPIGKPPPFRHLCRTLHVGRAYFEAAHRYATEKGWLVRRKKKLYTTPYGVEVCVA